MIVLIFVFQSTFFNVYNKREPLIESELKAAIVSCPRGPDFASKEGDVFPTSLDHSDDQNHESNRIFSQISPIMELFVNCITFLSWAYTTFKLAIGPMISFDIHIRRCANRIPSPDELHRFVSKQLKKFRTTNRQMKALCCAEQTKSNQGKQSFWGF